MKTTELVKAAKELNELFGLDPEIDLNGTPVKLTRQIKEAMLLLQTDDDITDATVKVLREVDLTDEDIDGFIEKEKFVKKEKPGLLAALEKLGIWINAEEEEEDTEETETAEEDEDGAPEDAEEVSLEDEIEEATKLSELKTIIKVNDEFKELRSQMTKYKTKEELKNAMMCVLETGSLPVVKTEKVAKIENTEANQILVLRDNAKHELAQIQSIEDGIDYLHKVKSIETWVKAEKKDAELQNIIAEQKLRTQRILGELIKKGQKEGSLATQQKHGRGIQEKPASVPQEDTRIKTLDDVGVSRNQSSTYQQISDIPEKEFENFIADKKEAVKNATDELTTKGAVKLAKSLNKKPGKEKTKAVIKDEDELIVLAGQIKEKYNLQQRQYLITLIKE